MGKKILVAGLAAVAILAVWSLELFDRIAVASAKREPIRKVVLVTIDTLRADRLGTYGYSRATSPNLDAWAEGALLFERAMAQSPWTVPSMGSILTGHYPIEVGTYTNRTDINRTFFTLARLFRENGYKTASFNTNSLLMHDDGGFRRDFDENYPERQNQKVPFVEVEPHVMRWLDGHAQENFFIWIHNMDPHSPPTNGNTYLQQNEWKGYDGEVKWMDEAMGRLFAKLKSLGIWDEILLVFTSDHGEAFFEHLLSGHQNVIYDEVLHVPLIIQYPGMTRTGRVGEPVELVDLYRTIAELAVLPVPEGIRGESLVPIMDGRAERREKRYLFHSRYYLEPPMQHHLAVRDREWKLIAKVPYAAPKDQPKPPKDKRPDWDLEAPGTTFELYRIDQDPRETTNLIFRGGDPEVATRLQQALRTWSKTVTAKATPDSGPPPTVDEATLETLRALGYE